MLAEAATKGPVLLKREVLGLKKDLVVFPAELSISDVQLIDRRAFNGSGP